LKLAVDEYLFCPLLVLALDNASQGYLVTDRKLSLETLAAACLMIGCADFVSWRAAEAGLVTGKCIVNETFVARLRILKVGDVKSQINQDVGTIGNFADRPTPTFFPGRINLAELRRPFRLR